MRVAYREGQRLRADDLTAEQDYLIALERRHNTAQHLPGVVAGLRGDDGVAVDAEGRLLIVDDAAPIGDAKCVDAWLIHCESCEGNRLQELARIITVAVTPAAPLSAPTADAVYLGRYGCHDDKRTPEYTSLMAATVKDPAGRAVMQIGPASLADRNAVLISATRPGGAPTPRIALDRFGNNRLIGTVTLADYHYCHLLPLTSELAMVLRSNAPGALGATLHLLITPKHDGGVRALEVQAFTGTKPSGEAMIWREEPDFNLAVEISKLSNLAIRFDAALLTQRLFLGNLQPLRPVRSAESRVQPSELFDRFAVQQDVPLHPCGGSLQIKDWPAAELHDPPGLSFKPMAETPKAPPIPGIYSVRTGDAKNPIEELRLDLGEKKENDLTVRFALGAHDGDNKPFDPWLQLSGVCNLILPAEYPNADPPVSVHVNGTIERGPIKPDLSDTNFTNLMAKAWLAGLQRVVPMSTQFEISFGLPSTIVETTDQFIYDVKVTNKSSLPGTAEGFIETLTVPTENPHILSGPIKPVASLPASSTTATFVTKLIHQPSQLPAGTIGIEVIVYGKSGGGWWWTKNTGSVSLVSPPLLDTGGIPETVPKDTPFDAVVGIVNEDATQHLTVKEITIDNDNSKVNVDIAPQFSEPFTRKYRDGIPSDLDINISASVAWGTNPPEKLDGSKHVKVKDDLAVDVKIASSTLKTVTFAVSIAVDDQPVTIKPPIVMKLSSSPTLKKIKPAKTDLAPHEKITTLVVVKRPLPTPVIVEVDLQYGRDGFTWHPPKFSKEIKIP